jgi:hypothetical protein
MRVWNRCQEKGISLEPPALLAALLRLVPVRLVYWRVEIRTVGVPTSVEPWRGGGGGVDTSGGTT